MYKIHLLPALFGDSILIEYGAAKSPRYILIDGGPYYGVKGLMSALKEIAPGLKQLELLVITHVDIDHIDGMITLLNQKKQPFKVKEVWFNGFNQLKPLKTDLLGALQGEYLTKLITRKGISHNKSFGGKAVMVADPENLPLVNLAGGMNLTLLSPHKKALLNLKNTWDNEISKITAKESIAERWKRETRYPDELGGEPPHPDNSIPNASSIAFIATYDKVSCLFAADTPSAELLRTIKPLCKKKKTKTLKVNAWKLAHHGSRKSTLPGIMKMIEAKDILVSTNGDRYKHPDKACLVALLDNSKKGLRFHFNYKSSYNEEWDEQRNKDKWEYQAFYPGSGNGITITLKK